MVYTKLKGFAEEMLGDYQCEFRSNNSTTNHIFTLRQIHEKAQKRNINLCNPYVDYK